MDLPAPEESLLNPMAQNERMNESRLVVSNSATPWTVAWQAPLSMEFSRQEYWSVAISFSKEPNIEEFKLDVGIRGRGTSPPL